ncbi:MAG: nitroreductase family protein [Thermoplasmatales archaeon]|nr:nitroreductase family protein [Thermoplasmatales archaeon]
MDLTGIVSRRRSTYDLGKTTLTEDMISRLERIAMDVPSAYNSQSQRIMLLLNKEHDALWDIVESSLRRKIGDERYERKTFEKIDSFRAAAGTVLFFDDSAVTSSFVERFPSGADDFPVWADHANGMMQYAFWLAFAELGLGASLQHYNPLIDEDVKERWNLPEGWKLLAQMPFGRIIKEPDAKEYIPVSEKMQILR